MVQVRILQRHHLAHSSQLGCLGPKSLTCKPPSSRSRSRQSCRTAASAPHAPPAPPGHRQACCQLASAAHSKPSLRQVGKTTLALTRRMCYGMSMIIKTRRNKSGSKKVRQGRQEREGESPPPVGQRRRALLPELHSRLGVPSRAVPALPPGVGRGVPFVLLGTAQLAASYFPPCCSVSGGLGLAPCKQPRLVVVCFDPLSFCALSSCGLSTWQTQLIAQGRLHLASCPVQVMATRSVLPLPGDWEGFRGDNA